MNEYKSLILSQLNVVVPSEEQIWKNDKPRTFIIIKSKKSETGNKIYYITDEKHNILREIINTGHMDWILTGDCVDLDPEYVWLQEDILYDINDDKIIKTILGYSHILGEILNMSIELCGKIALRFDEYSELSIIGKIVYLFEADTLLENFDGRYFKYKEDLYLFSQAPTSILEISNELYNNKLDDKKDFFVKKDLWIHYFLRLGTI
jgi:hypothetical protein